MRKLFLIPLAMIPSVLFAQLTVLRQGIKITQSVRIMPRVYFINTNDTTTAAIEIEGNNIIVDFNNAELDGNIKNQLPNKFSGIAIRIKSGKHITIKNLSARGYKVALIATGIDDLTIEHCDFSYNYRQHLNSTQQKEDLSDWMSYHHNENNEWLRYGAAIYLKNCNNAIVRENLVVGGQCALMLTHCNDGMIYNNNFSFNSGIGIGMYRSSGNKIIYNKLDFNIRGYSKGVYNRGQDSAAILVFEQCNNNLFACNSATHSGDGFFLWAGQTTMDTGKGGCNGNVLFRNDFSYAATNGIELTFSSNVIFENKIKGCDNGIWGGYSYDSKILYNDFADNKTAIAIEHGQSNKILYNEFDGDKTGIKLWANNQFPPDWGYSKNRDTRSIGYSIAGNSFHDVKSPVNITLTDSVQYFQNKCSSCMLDEKQAGHLGIPDTFAMHEALQREIPSMKYVQDIIDGIPYKEKEISYADNAKQIRMSEWGPYDLSSPVIWNVNPTDTSRILKFEIVGPGGRWKVVKLRGVKNISVTKGTIPATISASKTNEIGVDIFIELEYTGDAVTSPFGKRISKGKPYRFNYRNNLLPVNWQLSWYAFDSLKNPIKNPALIAELVKQPPIQKERTQQLNYAWWGGIGKEEKQGQFLTIAEGDIILPEADYEFSVSWDDAVRLYVDDKLVLNEWNPSKYIFDESPNREINLHLKGKHHLRAEHVELGGFATLIIKLKKK